MSKLLQVYESIMFNLKRDLTDRDLILENIKDFSDIGKAIETRKGRSVNPPNPNKDRIHGGAYELAIKQRDHVIEELNDLYKDFYFSEESISSFLDGRGNYSNYLGYLNGDDEIHFHETGVDFIEALGDVIDVDKLREKIFEESDVDDIDDIDDGVIEEYVESEYDIHSNIISSVFESKALDQMTEAFKEVVDELDHSGLFEIDDKPYVLDRKIKSVDFEKFKEVLSGISDSDYSIIHESKSGLFKIGQELLRQLKEDGFEIEDFEPTDSGIYEEFSYDDVITVVMNDVSEISEPYYGWGGWDLELFEDLVRDYSPELLKDFPL